MLFRRMTAIPAAATVGDCRTRSSLICGLQGRLRVQLGAQSLRSACSDGACGPSSALSQVLAGAVLPWHKGTDIALEVDLALDVHTIFICSIGSSAGSEIMRKNGEGKEHTVMRGKGMLFVPCSCQLRGPSIRVSRETEKQRWRSSRA